MLPFIYFLDLRPYLKSDTYSLSMTKASHLDGGFEQAQRITK